MSCINNCNCSDPCNCGCKPTTTTTCAPISPEPCYDLCDEVLLSDCIIYDGIDLDCYGIKKGDSVNSILNIIFDKLNVSTCSCSYSSVIVNWVPFIPPTTTTTTITLPPPPPTTTTTVLPTTSTTTFSVFQTTTTTTSQITTTSTLFVSTSTSTATPSTTTSTTTLSGGSISFNDNVEGLCLRYTENGSLFEISLYSFFFTVDDYGQTVLKACWTNVNTNLSIKWNSLLNVYELVNVITNQAIAYTTQQDGISNTWVVYAGFTSSFSNITTVFGSCESFLPTTTTTTIPGITTTTTTVNPAIQAIIVVGVQDETDPDKTVIANVIAGTVLTNISFQVTLSQYATINCSGVTNGPDFAPINMILNAGALNTTSLISVPPASGTQSLKVKTLVVGGTNVTSNPQVVTVGGYNYFIQGLGLCYS